MMQQAGLLVLQTNGPMDPANTSMHGRYRLMMQQAGLLTDQWTQPILVQAMHSRT